MRARVLFAEAADTTAAAFTDESAHGRKRLGIHEETQRSTVARQQLDAARMELRRNDRPNKRLPARFQSSMGGALRSGCGRAQKKCLKGAPLLDSWKAMTVAHQQEMQSIIGQMANKPRSIQEPLEKCFKPVDCWRGGGRWTTIADMISESPRLRKKNSRSLRPSIRSVENPCRTLRRWGRFCAADGPLGSQKAPTRVADQGPAAQAYLFHDNLHNAIRLPIR